jgi:hypothetical protein
MRRIEPDRRQHRHQFAGEVVAYPAALFIRPCPAAQEDDAFGFERWEDDVIEQRVLLGDELVCLAGDQSQCLLRGTSVRRDAACAQLHLFAQAADANLEELVEVARYDAQELQSLQQRHAVIRSLGKHPPVEGDQRKLTVDEVIGCETWNRQDEAHGHAGLSGCGNPERHCVTEVLRNYYLGGRRMQQRLADDRLLNLRPVDLTYCVA